jgi:hypothetical protein
MAVDLSNYTRRIKYAEDRRMFQEAVVCGENNALRACYLMLWTTLVESLKSRFIEIGKSDSEIGKVVGELHNKEQKHIAVDKYILDQGKKYGFFDDQTHQSLLYFYGLRSILIHPYSTNVTKEQIEVAASVIVNEVLAKPIKLRHSYGEQLVSNLMKPHYIDNTVESVTAFAKSAQSRMDISIVPWFIKKYLVELEKINQDKTHNMRTRLLSRGIWFIRSMIASKLAMYSSGEYHDLFIQYPYILSHILSAPDMYHKMPKSVKHSIAQYLFDSVSAYPRFLRMIETLFYADKLSVAHAKHFHNLITTEDFLLLKECALSTKTLAPRVLLMLQNGSYEISNQAIEFIQCSSFKLDEMDKTQQIELGIRLAYQYVKNNFKAINFINGLTETSLPFDAIKGLMVGCFISPSNCFTLSGKAIKQIFSFTLDATHKKEAYDTIIQYIDSCNNEYLRFYKQQIEEIGTLYPDNEIIQPVIEHLLLKLSAVEADGASDE